MASESAKTGGAETAGDKKGILLETGTNEFEIVELVLAKSTMELTSQKSAKSYKLRR